MIVRDLSNKEKYNDWSLDDITKRDVLVSSEIQNTIEKWANQYNTEEDNEMNKPSDAELKQIAMFKAKGWI